MAKHTVPSDIAMVICRRLLDADIPFTLDALRAHACVVHCNDEKALNKAAGVLKLVSNPRICPYNHPTRARCPHCADWERTPAPNSTIQLAGVVTEQQARNIAKHFEPSLDGTGRRDTPFWSDIDLSEVGG